MNHDALTKGIQIIYQTRVETAAGHECVKDALHRMRWGNSGSVVVVDADSVPIGILTDRDVAMEIVDEDRDPRQTTIAEIMTPSPAVLPEQSTVLDALNLMVDRGVRRLPVVGMAGVLVAIVTLDDIVRLLLDDFPRISRVLNWATPLPPTLEL